MTDFWFWFDVCGLVITFMFGVGWFVLVWVDIKEGRYLLRDFYMHTAALLFYVWMHYEITSRLARHLWP